MVAAEGASVVIHGIESELGAAVVESIRATGGSATLVLGDLVDPETPQRMVAEAIRVFGRLDSVVNNAGVSTRSSLESTTPELFDFVMAVNARAPVLIIQAALPYHREAGDGRIVNIGSVNAWAGGPSLLAYSMSKGAMMTMTRNLATGLAQYGIRVNQLNIGWTWTPNESALQRSHGAPEDWAERAETRMPFKRLLQPEDIAKMVCYLLSSDGELISGSVIGLDQANRIGNY
jgi:NAD(P)-dependent dehydrogenase (short-subunit alcohol dehydrogenase family)